MATKEELQKVLNIIQASNLIKKLDLAHDQWDIHQLQKIADALPDKTKLKKIIFAIPDSIEMAKAINNIFKVKKIKCSFIVPTQTNELEQALTLKVNESYKQKYFCGSTDDNVATVKQLDKGFTIYEETKLVDKQNPLNFNREFGSTTLYYANKEMEATPLGQNIPAEVLKTLENVNQENKIVPDKRIKKNKEAASNNDNNIVKKEPKLGRKNRGTQLYRRIKQNTIELWKKAFGGASSLNEENNEEAVVINHQGLALQVNLSAEVSTYSSISRGELYLPIGIKDVVNNEPISGGFVALREYGTKEQLKSLTNPEPIAVVHAVNCMFGAEFYGVDEQEGIHPLTIPGYELPSGRVIGKIIGKDANDSTNMSKPNYTSEDLHPDEILSRQMLQNFIAPMIKVVCNKEVRKLSYHAPLTNYTIYGINRYLKGQMTFSALVEYIECVRARAKEHRTFLENYAKEHGFILDLFSTMDTLGLADGGSDSVLSNLLNKLNLNEHNRSSYTVEEGEALIDLLYQNVMDYMSKQDNEIGVVWRALKKEKLRTFLENYAKEHGFIDLFSTMDTLGLADGGSDSVLSNLLNKLNLNEHNRSSYTVKEGEALIDLLYQNVMDYMSKQDNEIGVVWRALKVPIGKEKLHGLNYIDYAAAIAVSKLRHGMIFPIFPGNETEILERYGELFAKDFGKIPTLSFLPPFQVHINEDKNTVFYLENNTEQVARLLRSGLPRISGLQTYALAWNDFAVARNAAERANQILSENEANQLRPNANIQQEKVNNLRKSNEISNKKELLSSRGTNYHFIDQMNKKNISSYQSPSSESVSNFDFN